jgi:hypothetical protein
MKNFGAKWLALAVVFGAAAGLSLNGCGDGGGSTAKGGSGGSSSGGKGGTTGTGGATAGTGGSSAGHGGTTGTAGTGGSGGGTAGTGGSGGGTAGTGGSGGSPLNCPVGVFATGLEGFALNQYNTSPGNLFTREAGAKAAFAFESGMGDPAPGSVKIDAPYDAYDQLVDLQKGWSATTLQNWTGATKLHVRVKVASGLDPASTGIRGGVQPYVQTTSGYVDCRAWNSIANGKSDWGDYVLDLSTCGATWKIAEVISVGVTIETGNGMLGDAGVNSEKPTSATIYVDSFWLEGTCGGTGTGGAGGATGGSGGRGGSGGAGGATGGAGGATGGAGGATGGSGGAGGAAGHGGGGAGGATGGAGGATGGAGGATGGAGGATGGAGGATGGAAAGAGAGGHGGNNGGGGNAGSGN